MHLSDFLCQAFLVVSVLYIFGNPRSKSTSKAKLIADPGFYEVRELMFFQLGNCDHMSPWTRQTDIEQLLCTFRKCLIEMMTCVAGEAMCQEKAALEKCPANQTYILYNHDTCSVQASRRFLLWLEESCQDYYRRVSMTH